MNLTHKAPLPIIDRHLMSNSAGAALAGIPDGDLQEVQSIALGGSLSITAGVIEVSGTILGPISIGDPGTEAASITVNGVTYTADFKVNEFGGTRDALQVLHRHATAASFGANLVFARSRGNTSAHSNVASGDQVGALEFVSHYTSSYYRAASIVVEVDGTPGVTDMPGRILFKTSPDGSATPANALVLDSKTNAAVGGISPSAWDSSMRAVEIGRAGNALFAPTASGTLYASSNLRYNAGWFYANDGVGWLMDLGESDYFRLFRSASGLAGAAATLTTPIAIDGGAHVGLGSILPSAWHSSYPSVEFGTVGTYIAGATSSSLLRMGTANYLDSGSVFRYTHTGVVPAMVAINSDGFNFCSAASGTAGNAITWSVPMLVTPSGTVYSSGTGAGFFCYDRASGTDYSGLYHTGDETRLYNSNYGDAAVIKSNGNIVAQVSVHIGTFSATLYPLLAYNSHATTQTIYVRNDNTGGTLAEFSPGGGTGLKIKYTGGIQFPASINASTDANNLDEYEEGTWTPTHGITNTTVVEQASATYTRIGRKVHAQCYVLITNNTGAATNRFQIAGLPFSCNANNYGGVFIHYNINLNPPYHTYVQANQPYAEIYFTNNIASGANITVMVHMEYET